VISGRDEPSLRILTESITMSQYLGRGAVSRGRMTITSALNTVVGVNPYLNNNEDREAVITALDNLRDALKGVEGIEWQHPAPDQTSRDYVENVSKTHPIPLARHTDKV
jgi:cellobiose dehydrogenase (acceptor)